MISSRATAYDPKRTLPVSEKTNHFLLHNTNCFGGDKTYFYVVSSLQLYGITIMKNNFTRLAAVGFLIYSLGAQAQTITYQLDRTVGSGTVSGFIETNGTIGPLDPTDIVSWSLVADDGSGAHPPITIGSDSGGGLTGAGWDFFSATESELLFDFDGAFDSGFFADVQFFGGGTGFSVNYGFAAASNFIFGKKEQLVHFFDDPIPGQTHYVETIWSGLVVIGTVDGTGTRVRGVVHSVHIGGPDICELFGLQPGCDANYSGSAVLMADGSARGQFIDTFAGGGAGLHATIDCLHVAGIDAWLSGVIKHGVTPRGFDLAGLPIIIRVRDNGVSAHDPNDAVSFPQIGNPTPCSMAPDLSLFEYVHGQVQIR